MAIVSMKALLESGVHFGHRTNRWNPKMKRYIYGQRDGIYIIDLHQSLRRMEQAYNAVRDCTAAGGNFAGAVGKQYLRCQQRAGRRVLADDDELVAVVQRTGANPYQHLVGAGFGRSVGLRVGMCVGKGDGLKVGSDEGSRDGSGVGALGCGLGLKHQ